MKRIETMTDIRTSQIRTYDPATSVVFLKTNERFGGLSNMAPGFPLRVNGIHIRTSEAIYQACRFPHMPNVQQRIINERSPMTAKRQSKPFRKDSRSDWYAMRIKIMRWCLRVKLAQNWEKFGKLLEATNERPIVEQSRYDDFWGAKVAKDGSLVGMNILGRLLMEIRRDLKSDKAKSLRTVEPLPIPDFLLFQRPIDKICNDITTIANPIVFIGGSRSISYLHLEVKQRLNQIIAKGLKVLIGDADGADKAVQQHFKDHNYSNVCIFHMSNPNRKFNGCRNNLSNWSTTAIDCSKGTTGKSFYAMKDRIMTKQSSVGFMIWDSESNGTLNNMKRLLNQGKPVVVHCSTATPPKYHRFFTLKDLKGFYKLLGHSEWILNNF